MHQQLTTTKPGNAAITAPNPYSEAVFIACQQCSACGSPRAFCECRGYSLISREHDKCDADDQCGFHGPDCGHGLDRSCYRRVYARQYIRRYRVGRAVAVRGNEAGPGKWSPTIEEFWAAMDAKPTHRANFKALRQRIIEPAVAELREKNGLLIDWQSVKDGRRVGTLRLEFVRNPQGALF
jgi:hypothetical protein